LVKKFVIGNHTSGFGDLPLNMIETDRTLAQNDREDGSGHQKILGQLAIYARIDGYGIDSAIAY
jgi:hypothetical protein